MSGLEARLRANIDRVFQQVQEACESAGRSVDEVLVVAVSKYVDLERTRLLADCLLERDPGQTPQLGESRPQLLAEKTGNWGDGPPVEWHFIGPLQSNKISKVVPAASVIHSIDRLDLLKKLERFGRQNQVTIQGLLEFNISQEPAKHGFIESDCELLAEYFTELKSVKLTGLMGMSGLEASAAEARAQFESLAQWLPQVRAKLPIERRAEFKNLSMGMSGDMPQAIAAGATMVRIGSGFWEGLR